MGPEIQTSSGRPPRQCSLHYTEVKSLLLAFFFFLIFIYLAAPGLSYDMRTLSCSMWDPVL